MKLSFDTDESPSFCVHGDLYTISTNYKLISTYLGDERIATTCKQFQESVLNEFDKNAVGAMFLHWVSECMRKHK